MCDPDALKDFCEHDSYKSKMSSSANNQPRICCTYLQNYETCFLLPVFRLNFVSIYRRFRVPYMHNPRHYCLYNHSAVTCVCGKKNIFLTCLVRNFLYSLIACLGFITFLGSLDVNFSSDSFAYFLDYNIVL